VLGGLKLVLIWLLVLLSSAAVSQLVARIGAAPRATPMIDVLEPRRSRR
jgi:hypothetical protein